MSPRTIQQVFEECTAAWITLPGVVGAAIGEHDGRPCIVVYAAEGTGELRAKIPVAVEGYPVVLEPTGEFRAF